MKVDTDVVPRNLEHAVGLLRDGLEPKDHAFIECNPSVALHHTFGRWMRNNWSLWDNETVLVKWFQQELGIGHADDISGIILERLWADVRGVPYDIEAHISKIYKHWATYKVNPITGEEL